MKTLQVVCAIIIREGKLLVAQRSDTMSLPLKWELPGGKIDANETEVECLKRELKEELDIEVDVVSRFTSHHHDYIDFKIELNAYIAYHASGSIHLYEHHQVKWLEKEALKHLDWAPADIPIILELLSSEYL